MQLSEWHILLIFGEDATFPSILETLRIDINIGTLLLLEDNNSHPYVIIQFMNYIRKLQERAVFSESCQTADVSSESSPMIHGSDSGWKGKTSGLHTLWFSGNVPSWK